MVMHIYMCELEGYTVMYLIYNDTSFPIYAL